MKKTVILLVLSIVLNSLLIAEEWEKSGTISLNVNQNSYSDNWVGDEISNFNWALNLNATFQKQLSNSIHNKNTVKLAFGQTHNQQRNDAGEKYWEKPSKSTDLIDLESMFRFTMGWFADPFAAVRFESQFLDSGYDESKMINPINLTESIGLARQLIKEDKRELTTRLGAAFKQFQDSRIDGMIDATDGGLEFVTEFFTPLMNDMVQFNSKLYLYQALFYSEEDSDPDDNWKAMDMNWENILSAKLIGLVNINFYMQLLYDKQFVDEFRIKQTLGLGLSYQLF
jgi:hypothetical protein